jgi:outer membrane lipoprotein-sorting protein
MSAHRLKITLTFALLLLTLLAACGGSASTPSKPTPTPSPAPDQGAHLLTTAAQMLNGAQTLHSIFAVTIAGPTINGSLTSEIWNAAPDKSRTLVLQSTVTQFPSGSINVSNGTQAWQYNPAKKVVYTGQVSATGTGTPTRGASDEGNQNQLIFNLVRSVFSHSNATLVSTSASINGHSAYDIHVTPQAQASGTTANTFSYDGDVYLDKSTNLPLRVKLNIQGFGQVTLDLTMLTLNQPIDNSLFTFVPPAGVKVLPFPPTTPDTGSLTLSEAQQQAGYHLLSIPTSQAAYSLQTVDALGAPGNQIYTLNYLYTQGNIKFSISEGKALANLPTSGQQISLRGTTGTIAAVGDTATLSWTEKGVGLQIAGQLSNAQLVAIANLLG